MLDSLLTALFTGIAVFLALELHGKISKVRDVYGGKLPLKEVFKPLISLIEKTEFLPPMNDEEYEQYMFDQSDKGALVKKVLAKTSWISEEKKSQSSDS